MFASRPWYGAQVFASRPCRDTWLRGKGQIKCRVRDAWPMPQCRLRASRMTEPPTRNIEDE
jgi:hypothetical protein